MPPQSPNSKRGLTEPDTGGSAPLDDRLHRVADAIRKTHTVTSDDAEADPSTGDEARDDNSQPPDAAAHAGNETIMSSDESSRETDAESDDETEGVPDTGSGGVDDIAWPVPKLAMIPLAVVLSGLMVWAFGLDWVLTAIVPFAIFLAVMIVIDLRELRIPDKLTRPAALATLPLLALSLLSDWSDISLLRAVLGALAMGGFYLVLFLIYPAGMGFGDVKLAPIIGAHLGFFGWVPLIRGVIAAYFIVGPVAILLLIIGRARRKSGFPFGPFMAAGALVALALEASGR